MEEIAFLKARIAEWQQVMQTAAQAVRSLQQRVVILEDQQRRASRVVDVLMGDEPVGMADLRPPGTGLARIEEE